MPFEILYCSGDITEHGECFRGGAKRHRKILRDNIQGITKVCIPLPSFRNYPNTNCPRHRSLLSVVLLVVVVSSVSLASSMRRHEVF
jgi:hypothetical protein